MSRIILTTCGTSLFTSNCWKENNLSKQPALLQADIDSRPELERKYRMYTSGHKENDSSGKSLVGQFDDNVWKVPLQIAKLPAELASLKAIQKVYEKHSALGSGDEIVLLHSDNEEGKYCADVVRLVLEDKKFNLIPDVTITPNKIEGLDPSDHQGFVAALDDIWKQRLEQFIELDSATKLIFNLTGGYKGTAILLGAIAYKFHQDVDIKVFYYHEKAAYEDITVMTFVKNQFGTASADLSSGQIRESAGCPMEF